MSTDPSISLNQEDEETTTFALRSALVAGEESGAPEVFDFGAFVAAKIS